MEITTIGFANPFSAVSRRRGGAPPASEIASDVKVNVSSTERQRASGVSGMLVLTTVSIEPPESYPIDRLLPQSRLQQMKKLLERAAVAYPDKMKGAR